MSAPKAKNEGSKEVLEHHNVETASDIAAREAAFTSVLKTGAGAGTVVATVAGGAVAVLSRRWPPMAHVSLPFRAFGVLGAGLAAGVIAAENTSVKESRRAYDETVSEDQRFSHADHGIDYSRLSARDRVLAWAKDHRWSGVAYGWAASMGVSMYFVNRQPLDFKQKVVQARIYAQVITIVLLVAAGALATVHTAADPETDDDESKEALRERAMYRFKKGSEAEKRVQNFEKEMHDPKQGIPPLPEGKA